MTSALQRELVQALRDALPRLCCGCREGRAVNAEGFHVYSDPRRFWTPCQASEIRELIERAEKEMGNG